MDTRSCTIYFKLLVTLTFQKEEKKNLIINFKKNFKKKSIIKDCKKLKIPK